MKKDIASVFTGSASPLAISGAALYWLWMDSAVFSATLLGAGSGDWYGLMFLLTTLCTVLLFSVLLYQRSDSSAFTRDWRVSSVVSGCMGCVGSLLVTMSGRLGSLPLLVAGSVLNGLCFAHLNLLWGLVCVSQGHEKALVHISAAWSLGLPFNLLFAVVQPAVASAAVAVLPLLSVAVFWVLYGLQDRPSLRVTPVRRERVDIFRGRGVVLGIDVRLLALIAVFCTVFGLMYGLSVDPNARGASPGSSIGAVGTRGLTALVFCVAGLTVLRDRVQLFFKSCFYALVAGLAVMVVGMFVPEMGAVGPLMVAVGYCGFDVLVWTMIAFHGYVSDQATSKVIALTMLVEQAGIGLGALFGLGSLSQDVSVVTETSVMMVLNLIALAVLVAYTEYGSRLWTLLVKTSMGSDEAIKSNEASGELDTLARRYGLTRREREIVAMFVSGRSMSYIAEKLFVSENTVKTHVRHIYNKCGVHNKQELIDLAEVVEEF